MRSVYEWIRDKDPDTEIFKGFPLARFFPNGPHNQPEKQVDIVVDTPDGTSSPVNSHHSL